MPTAIPSNVSISVSVFSPAKKKSQLSKYHAGLYFLFNGNQVLDLVELPLLGIDPYPDMPG
jgi:hypothetical protein